MHLFTVGGGADAFREEAVKSLKFVSVIPKDRVTEVRVLRMLDDWKLRPFSS